MTRTRPIPVLSSAAARALAFANASCVPNARARALGEKGRACSASSM